MLRVRELTPHGGGGISVLAVTGPAALERVQELLPHSTLLRDAPVLARLESASGALDEILICVRSEDAIELHLHASPVLVAAVRRALDVGEDGESRGPADQLELAGQLLPSAPCESAARILLDQAEGALVREIELLSGFDDADVIRGLADLCSRSLAARFAFEPARVVLAGPVNAGKSTLFNVLLGAQRATVSDVRGTTRDALCERALLGRYPVDLVDTAGEGSLPSTGLVAEVERRAQAIAREWSRRADLVLWLSPPGADPSAAKEAVGGRGSAPSLVIPSRVDLLKSSERPEGGISALEHPAAARERVSELFRRNFRLPLEPWEPGRGVVIGAEAREELARLSAAPAVLIRTRLHGLLGTRGR